MVDSCARGESEDYTISSIGWVTPLRGQGEWQMSVDGVTTRQRGGGRPLTLQTKTCRSISRPYN